MENNMNAKFTKEDIYSVLLINQFCIKEYDQDLLSSFDSNFQDPTKIGIAYTTIDSNNDSIISISSTVDLINHKVQHWVNDKLYSEEDFENSEALNDYLANMSFEELTEGFVFYPDLEKMREGKWDNG